MITQSSVKEALNIDVRISPEMADALRRWSLMYINQAEWLGDEVKSLQLPAALASEIARAVTIEMDIEIGGSLRADYLYEQIDRIYPKLRTQIEYGAAKGGLILKPYISGNKRDIIVDFVQADQFYPVSFDASGRITACVFSDVRQVGKSFYTRLEYHRMIGAGCQITNQAYKSDVRDVLGKEVPLSAIPEWELLAPEATITNVDRLLVGYFRYPLANNIDPTSPLGVSCYARAVELIEQADQIWSNLVWEFESGKRAIYADSLAFGKGADGKPVLPNRRLYRALDGVGNVGQGGKLFEAWSPEFREAAILSGLDAVLKRIEFQCGLAYGTISDPATEAKTATEIKISKQRTYATITDAQKALEMALEDLLYAMDVWATLGNLAPSGKWEAVYNFDDSIVADHDTQFAQDSQALGLGTMSKTEWRMKTYGETEEIARAKLAMIAQEMQPVDFFADTPS